MLGWLSERSGSDLHGQENKPYVIRAHGRLERVSVSEFAAPGGEDLRALLRENFTPETCRRIEEAREVDLSFTCGRLRYRANFSKQQGRQSFSFRVVPQQRQTLRELQLPKSLLSVIQRPRGMVIVTGPAGQGKSTTVRALIQEINETQAMRIITIEDPIEYVFEDALSQLEQREVGLDTATFADGIRNAMRQDPNVILVGEIRDRESIFAAVQAAETGHLVLTTLHADSIAQAVGRIREYYPSTEQANISSLLARNINAIINQRLIPNRQGTRTPCLELMKRDAGVQEAIEKNDLGLLSGIVEASANAGMHSFDQYLVELLAARVIDEATARTYAVNQHKLDLRMRGIITSETILRPETY